MGRSIPGIDVIMAKAVGSKRSARHIGGQSELQKKKKTVSQDGKGNNLILVEAGSQSLPEPMSLLCWNYQGLGNP